MGDGAYELQVRFAIEDFSEVFEKLGKISTFTEAMVAGYEEMVDTTAKNVKNVQQQLEFADQQLKKADLLLKTHQDDFKVQEEALDVIKEALEAILEIASTNIEGPIMPEQIARAGALIDSLGKAEENINKARQATSEWKKAMEEVGLGHIYDQMQKLGTTGFWIGLWAKMFGEAAKNSAKWREQNSAVYGSVTEIQRRVNAAADTYNLLTEEAMRAGAALRNVRIDDKNFDEAVGIIGQFSAATGVSEEAAASYMKQLELVGMNLDSQRDSLNATRAAMEQYGLTSQGASTMLSFLSDNALLLKENVGGSSEAFNKAQSEILAMAGALEQVGISASRTSQIMGDLNENVFEYAVTMGEYIKGVQDPMRDGMLAIMANAEGMANQLRAIEDSRIRQQFAKEVFKFNASEIFRMEEAFEKYADATDLGAEGIRKFMREGKPLPDHIREQFNAAQLAGDVNRQFKKTIDELTRSVVTLILPIVKGVAAVLEWVAAVMDAMPWLKDLIKWTIVLKTAIVALKFALGGLSILGTIVPLFKRLGQAIKSTGESAAKAGGGGISKSLKSLGAGLKDFFKSMSEIKMRGVVKTAGAILIFGVALIALGYAAYYVPPGKLIELSTAMLMMSASMYVLAEASDVMAKNAGNLIIAATAMVIFGAAVVVLAAALKIAEGVSWQTLIIMAAFVIIAAGALAFLAYVIGPVAPIAIAAVGIFLLLAVAFVVLAAAALIFAVAMEKLAGVNLIALGVSLLTFSAMLLASSAMFMAGMTMMLAAGIIGIAAATTLGVAFAVLAGILPIAIVGMLAAKIVSIGLEIILGTLATYSGVLSQLPIVAKFFGDAMWQIKRGMEHIVGAPWIKFRIGAGFVETGLRKVLGAISDNASAIAALPIIAESFSAAMRGIKNGAWSLVGVPDGADWKAYSIFRATYWLYLAGMLMQQAQTGVKLMIDTLNYLATNITEFSGANNLAKTAWDVYAAFQIIEFGMGKYAWWIDRHTKDIAASIMRVAGAMSVLRMTGLDEMVRTSAMVTVQTELEDKQRQEESREEQTDILENISSSMASLVALVGGLNVGEGVGEHLEEMKSLLSTWLPEIAESDKGLASATNQWSSGFG